MIGEDDERFSDVNLQNLQKPPAAKLNSLAKQLRIYGGHDFDFRWPGALQNAACAGSSIEHAAEPVTRKSKQGRRLISTKQNDKHLRCTRLDVIAIDQA